MVLSNEQHGSSDLSPAEVNERLAQVMGFKFPSICMVGGADWDPCSNDNHMRMVRDEIARRGFQERFIYEMWVTLEKTIPGETGIYEAEFELMNASCEVQARAALRVLEADKALTEMVQQNQKDGLYE